MKNIFIIEKPYERQQYERPPCNVLAWTEEGISDFVEWDTARPSTMEAKISTLLDHKRAHAYDDSCR